VAVKDNDKGFNRIKRELKKIERAETNVGVQAGEDHDESELSLAQIAFNNEYGTSRIPSRPFMRNTYANNKEKLNKIIDSEFGKILDGARDTVTSVKLVGEWYEAAIKSEIRTGDFVANAPSTIAEKNSSKPLIDTGQLINSIRHEEKF
jgi:HK97 gp10 family phage protein